MTIYVGLSVGLFTSNKFYMDYYVVFLLPGLEQLDISILICLNFVTDNISICLIYFFGFVLECSEDLIAALTDI